MKRASYDRELAAGKGRTMRRTTTRANDVKNEAQTAKDFDNFMNMFDQTVAGMSEEEINMAMGAAAVVGGVIGSILGARAAKGNSFLSSVASMAGSAMASQAASTLVKSVHEDSVQRVLEKEERDAAIARGESVPRHSASQGRDRMLQDAVKTFQKVAEAAMCGVSSSNVQARMNSSSGNNNNATTSNNAGSNGKISWEHVVNFATMAADAVAEMQRASKQQNAGRNG